MGSRGTGAGAQSAEDKWISGLTDAPTYQQFIKVNMPDPDFKQYGRTHTREETEMLFWRKRTQEELKDVHEVPIEDAIQTIRDNIPSQTFDAWFLHADSGLKPKLISFVLSRKGTLNAALNIAYHNYLDDMKMHYADEKPLGFKKWLTTPQTLYRGTHGQKVIAKDVYMAYSRDRSVAQKFAGKSGNVTSIQIRPIDTWGSYQTNAEQEYLVPITHARVK